MVYYMGMYGYGTDITTPDERSYRLARLDASEYLAMTVAPLISPYLFQVKILQAIINFGGILL